MKTGCRVLLSAAMGGAWLAGAAQAQVLSEGLVFHAITPCRVFDTRPGQGGTGPLAPGATATFRVVGKGAFENQGGHATGCGIPQGTTGRPPVQAVMLNFVAVNPSGPGHLRAWPSDEAVPNASILNFTTATTVANGVIVAVSQEDIGETDISVRADGSATNVLADVVGYFLRQDMGSRGACYGSFCQGSTLVAGANYLWGDALDAADIHTFAEQTCLVTADVAMTGSLPSTGAAEVRTAARNITHGFVMNDSFANPQVVGFGFPTYGRGDNIGSASKTYAWPLWAGSEYRFGCHVQASGGYVGAFAQCYVSWICR